MRIAVVGSCGSGKSTIVDALLSRGYDAYVVGQEHSAIAELWNHKHPDALVYLDVSLDAVRERRSPYWPEWLFHQQQRRLESARDAASIRVDTSKLGIDRTVEIIIDGLPDDASG